MNLLKVLDNSYIPKEKHSALAGALVGAGVSALGSIVGASQVNSANANLNATNRKWQERQNAIQRNWSEKMWQAENAYNTPEMQKKRLVEGGFNPWLASGQAGVSNSAATLSSPGMQGAPGSIPMQDVIGQAVNQGVNTYMSAASMQANIANQNADTIDKASKAYTSYLNATGDYKGGQALFKSLLGGVNASDRKISDLTKSINIDYVRNKIAADREDVAYQIEAQYGKEKAQKELNLLDKNVAYLDEQMESLRKGRQLSDAQIANFAQDTAKKLQETEMTKEQREFLLRKVEAEAKILEADPMLNDWFSGAVKSAPVLNFLLQLVKLLK